MKIFEILAPIEEALSRFGRLYYHGTARSNVCFHPTAVAYFSDRLEDAREHARMDPTRIQIVAIQSVVNEMTNRRDGFLPSTPENAL